MSQRSTKLLRLAFWLNISFAVFELIGGYISGSLAILSDALHDFGDSLSLGLAWYFQHLSQRRSDDKFSFGYARFSTLGALVNSLILILGSAFLLYLSISTFCEREAPLTGWMMIIAVIGVVINTVAFKTLHSGDSLNEKTAALHLLEDVVGWIAVLIGAIVMYFTGWAWIDSLLSVAIAVWIGTTAVRQLLKSTGVFMQSVPPGIDLDEVCRALEADPRVREVHNVRIWSLDGSDHVVSMHVVLDSDMRISEVEAVRRELKSQLQERGLMEVTLQFEAPRV
ncbi:cation diffusion facilitator family transporter [Phaeocystidibacter luteus]|uniref:Cation transporter n=1 Tax=Phaeocystidibacter luteus TaxID=911197 RepID=A0A6N6RIL6_9FLAO|nr:cation diffusion facilitator family transporter [Phaeocystidibacter luteus]KAB2810146.1 cation transporter [Phaeocystidibacter luteus]